MMIQLSSLRLKPQLLGASKVEKSIPRALFVRKLLTPAPEEEPRECNNQL